MGTVGDLYFSSASTRQFTPIAIAAGWRPGAQLPNAVYAAPEFVDQNYRKPDLERYAAKVRDWTPALATVLDWGQGISFQDVMTWAEAIAPFVCEIIVIPKIPGTVSQIPTRISGRPVRLGYSVPTSHGGTSVSFSEFGIRPVHLLGGSPQLQYRIAHFLNVVSLDNNYIQKMALHNQFFSVTPVPGAKNKWFPQLAEVGDGDLDTDTHLEAFSRSAENVIRLWKGDLEPLPMFG